MNSKRRRKKEWIRKTCTSKRTYRTAREAKLADPDMYRYRCPICYNWHLTSTPNSHTLDEIMKETR